MVDGEGSESPTDEDPFPKGNPPGPDGWPILGNAVPFFRKPFEYRERVAEEYGDVVQVSGLGRQAYMISHPEYIRQVLVEEADRFRKPAFEKRFVKRVFGESLAFVDGEQWRQTRHLVQPAFTLDRIETYGERMVESAEAVARSLKSHQRVAVDEVMKRLTFAVLTETLFGRGRDADDRLRSSFEAVATKLRPRNAIIPDWLPTPTNRRFNLALSHLEDEIDDMIAQRRHNRDTAGDDLLSLLVSATENSEDDFSDERLRDEMMGFLFAGHETTAMGLTFAWYLLGTNPSSRARLHEELVTVCGGDRPTVEDLGDLDYLDRVMRESLRLYPPNHMIPREPTEPIAIGGYRVEPDASVYLPQWVVQRDSRWYDDPEEFQPDRWLDDDRQEYAYFPFGGGPRHCIGMRFARLEMRLAIAAIAQEVTLDPVSSDPPELAAGLTIHPVESVEAAVSRRDE